MRFTKMHGLGNDFVFVNCFEERVKDPGQLAKTISDRHFGIGSDGLILIEPPKVADIKMRVFNADGSEAEMCGNGIRCAAKFAFDRSLSDANPMRIETLAGIKVIDLKVGDDGEVTSVSVDMGEAIFDPTRIPVNIPQKRIVDHPIRAGKEAFKMTCLSMGNPHAVIYVDDVEAVTLEQVGPELEHSPLFPQRINVHFVQVRSAEEVTMRTWERGSGATLACGTGAAAVCAAGIATKRTGKHITAHLPGGDLVLQWGEENEHVYLTGPATEVFTGDWPT